MLMDGDRDLAVELMRMGGFEVRPCWPFLITEQPATQGAVTKTDGSLKHARYFANHIINIPINPACVEGQLDRLEKALPLILNACKQRS